MREWTEQHIRELVRKHAGPARGSLAQALQLRSWIAKVPAKRITCLDGQCIDFEVKAFYGSESILGPVPNTLIALTITNPSGVVSAGPSYFVADPWGHITTKLTYRSISSTLGFWEIALLKLADFFGNSLKVDYWTQPTSYQKGEIYCDGKPAPNVLAIWLSHPAYWESKGGYESTGNVIKSLQLKNLPPNTKKVEILYQTLRKGGL